MGLLKKMNHTQKFNAETKGLKFVTLEQLYNSSDNEEGFTFVAIYFNKKGRYGTQPILVLKKAPSEQEESNRLVGLPTHMTQDCELIVSNADMVDSIKNGSESFTVYEYESKKTGRACYSIEWN